VPFYKRLAVQACSALEIEHPGFNSSSVSSKPTLVVLLQL